MMWRVKIGIALLAVLSVANGQKIAPSDLPAEGPDPAFNVPDP